MVAPFRPFDRKLFGEVTFQARSCQRGLTFGEGGVLGGPVRPRGLRPVETAGVGVPAGTA